MTACEAYEKRVNDKVNHFVNHPKYPWLRAYTDDAIRYHTGAGYYQIKAADFMDRIDAAPLEVIQEFLDGKNHLEWELINQNKSKPA